MTWDLRMFKDRINKMKLMKIIFRNLILGMFLRNIIVIIFRCNEAVNLRNIRKVIHINKNTLKPADISED